MRHFKKTYSQGSPTPPSEPAGDFRIKKIHCSVFVSVSVNFFGIGQFFFLVVNFFPACV